MGGELIIPRGFVVSTSKLADRIALFFKEGTEKDDMAAQL